ncbi:MAG: hypothetical protein HYS80_02315 [Candidatus Aenigmarchaeota archaeon]|nr:hypothetical protein [Candidatus Aenigmarchaeota archaeon]
MAKHLIFVKVNGQDDFAELQDTEVLWWRSVNRIEIGLGVVFPESYQDELLRSRLKCGVGVSKFFISQ